MKWQNRFIDDRSLSLIAARFWWAMALLSILLALELWDSQGFDFVPFWIRFSLYFLALAGFVGTVLADPITESLKSGVPLGYRAAIKFRNRYTGEIAETGQLIIPYGYSYDLFDCRPETIQVGPSEASTQDGFKVEASITATIRINNPLAAEQLTDRQLLMRTSLSSALHEALSATGAVQAVGNRQRMIDVAINGLNARLVKYGMSADYVDINVVNIPDSSPKVLATLNELKGRFPNASTNELMAILLSLENKLGRTQFDFIGIDAIVELVREKL